MSTAHMFPFSSVPWKRIDRVQFSVMSPEELKGYSVTQKLVVRNERPIPAGVTSHETYRDGEPVRGGVNDPRMGSAVGDNNHPGYFGHIELARPVYHVGFLNTVLAILRCVSFYDGGVLFTRDEDVVAWDKLQLLEGKNRLGALSKMSVRFTTCPRSNLPQPRYRKDGLRIVMNFGEKTNKEQIPGTGETQQVLTAAQALEILKKISDEDARILGLNPKWCHPSWLILQVLPVPPPQVRPSVSMGGAARCEDDLTHKLSDIVKANLAVLHCERNGDADHVLEQYIKVLQYHCATFVDNQLPYQAQASQKSGKPLKTLRQRLVGKEGRVRGNLMGKRVDFSARTVITADPNLSIDQVGVPRSIALNLTVPERVTAFNLERLKNLVRNGPDKHPGARYIINDQGLKMDLRYSDPNEVMLKKGWIVERHLANDDVVLFNRQPSLHKMSIMGHRVRVMYWSTFRMNLSVTSPYNADFDGDEMNLHVPQGLTARAEAETNMMVNKVIVSPQSNRPVMGIVQDSLLSSWRMTRRDIFLNQNELFNLLMWVEDFDGNVPIPAVMVPDKTRAGSYHALWTGKQVFSSIVPAGINLSAKANGHDKSEKFPRDLNPEDTAVLIQNGEIITGIIDKSTLGAKQGGLIHTCFNEMGPEVTRVLMNQIQKLSNHFILHHGFTVGVGDTVADDATLAKVRDVLEAAKLKVADLVKQGQRGMLKVQPGRTMQESFEDHVNICLNEARDNAGKESVKSLTAENNFKATVTSGSKGSFINISQIMGCVGQQNVEGQRIPFGFRYRTLPHFYKDDLGPESRGFVENSYLKGLSPQEFYFHAMGGREGLIDTACKTAETGYIQRRLVKALEDLSVRYDGTVRNGRGDIIQFLYGEDGMDGAFVETQVFDLLRKSKREFEETYVYRVDDADFGMFRGKQYLMPNILHKLRHNPEAMQILNEEAEQLRRDQALLRLVASEREPGGVMSVEDKLHLPVNIARMIWNVSHTYRIDKNRTSDLDPCDIVHEVSALCDRLVVVLGEDPLSREAQDNATKLIKILIRSSLASKVILVRHRLTKDAFKSLIGQIESRFFKSMVNPGEMCGVLAAQSIGEPATQMTLNTFHFAGVSAKNVTLGVPRLKEVINGAKNVKTPSVTVYLDEEHRNTEARASEVMSRLEFTRLRELAVETSIIFDPKPEETVVEEDYSFVSGYWEIEDGEDNVRQDQLSPWLLRIVAEKKIMRFKKISNSELIKTIHADFGDTLHCIANDDNSDECVVHIRVVRDNVGGAAPGKEGEGAGGEDGEAQAQVVEDEKLYGMDEFIFLRRLETELLDNLRLRGIPNIKKCFVREFDKAKGWDPETGAEYDKKEWVLDTDGTNLLAILAQPGVDHKRTVSNHCIEIWQVLGAEALRRSLLNEIRAVISFDGSYVNYRHLSMLVDVMAARGELQPVTRHGINRNGSGPLQRCSFEETVELLMDAAAFSECDPLAAVSENIMLGQLAPIGTGAFDLYIDEEMLKDAIEVDAEEELAQEAARDPHLGPSNAMATPLAGAFSPTMSPGAYAPFSPAGDAGFSPGPGGGPASPAFTPSSPYSPASPAYQPQSPAAGASPSYNRMSSAGAQSPGYNAGGAFSPSSPAYSPASPGYNPSSPTSPMYGSGNAASPGYSPSSPAAAYSPSSPAAAYSPSSPAAAYSPSSPAAAYSPSSPAAAYSPSSPAAAYSPSSPAQAYSPSSPAQAYSPSSPAQAYSPSSPAQAYSPSSPAQAYSPSSPAAAYSPASPAYSPSSPAAGPMGRGDHGAAYSPASPAYSPASPAYSPSSPAAE
ncbi:DNA-directed RNA polymerase subunit [Hondaea fermentalgiana]|uniref:DNA-directed RNA polymerase subunit n=1 Tax=Hondaea fermentalgiana TaxID=2315210 RepID=A0A2R5GU24_9STRA|nr:DNA-directed RNA polymerase subunit [Hondaea fermentalgiana]|eukprot:GBG34377.1 DNA-directed RNA polymerase subunit [Hondaea fermentalgiana]